MNYSVQLADSSGFIFQHYNFGANLDACKQYYRDAKVMLEFAEDSIDYSKEDTVIYYAKAKKGGVLDNLYVKKGKL